MNVLKTRSHLFIAAALFGMVLFVYAYTLCPTVYWDDAGELIAACYTLGIPHPPGHPLYAILGKLFTLVPLGSPAYRVNLMSAFFGALTCAMLFQIVRELVRREERIGRFANFAGVTAALCGAFSSTLWEQSVVAETTTLHSFFMLTVTLLAFRIEAAGPDSPRLTRRLLAFSFIYGLSFTNHVAGLFFAPSVAFILLSGLRLKLFKPARLLAMVALFLLGLSVYAYLPLRSRFDPAIDWGNPETLKNFLWVVTAQQYSSNLLRLPGLVDFARGLRSIVHLFLSDLTLPGCALALAGALGLWKTGKRAVIGYGAIVILILFLVSLNSAFISAYLVPAVLMLTIWLGFGTASLCGWAERAASALSGVRGRLLARSFHCAAVLLFLALLIVHFPENNKRGYRYAKQYGESLLSSLPHDAVLITGTADPLFISWYLQYCENYRTDVKVITRNGLTRPGYLDQIRRRYPELNIPQEFHYESDEGVRPSHLHARKDGLPWFANSYFKLFYEMNVSKFPIFWEGIESNQLLMDQFVPHHLVFQILPAGEKVSSDVSDVPNAVEIGERIGHDLAAGRIYGNHLFNYGVYYQWNNDIAAAERFYEDSLRLYPNDSRALNNIGAILAERGEEDEAFEKFLAAFRANPDDAASNHNVGQAFLNRGEARKAVPYFRRAISSDVPSFEDYHNLGLCYADMGKNRKAAEMFQEALRLKPDSPEVLSSLGVVYLRLRETESARKLLKTAVELEPDNAQNWYNFACLQALEGDRTGSSGSLGKALSLDYKDIYDLASNDPRMSPILDSLPTVK